MTPRGLSTDHPPTLPVHVVIECPLNWATSRFMKVYKEEYLCRFAKVISPGSQKLLSNFIHCKVSFLRFLKLRQILLQFLNQLTKKGTLLLSKLYSLSEKHCLSFLSSLPWRWEEYFYRLQCLLDLTRPELGYCRIFLSLCVDLH